jgi:hypothetical protein
VDLALLELAVPGGGALRIAVCSKDNDFARAARSMSPSHDRLDG